MKIAVLVYGEYREFDNVVDSWKIFNTLNCDFYFSTWATSKQNNKCLGISREFDITHQMILKYYPNAVVDIRNRNDYEELNECWGTSAVIYNHWKNCVKLLNDSKKEYDFILILRPDLYFSFNDGYNETSFEILKKMYKKDILLLCGDYKKENNIFFTTDYFIFGSYNILKKLLIDASNFGGDIHHDLGKYIYDNNIEFIQNNIIKVDIVRPNAFYKSNSNIITKRYSFNNKMLAMEPINVENEFFYDRDYFHKKQVEWDLTLSKKPLSD